METQTQTQTDFDAALQRFIDGLNAKLKASYDESNYPENLREPAGIIERGNKYIRVVRIGTTGQPRSVYCFIVVQEGTTGNLGTVRVGDVMKPAGWKAPTKHARGNIFNADNGLDCCGPYGVAYLR